MTRKRRRKSKNQGPYLVREYHCKKCHHIFHTARPYLLTWCNHCGGELEVLGQYKSKFAPGVSRKKPGGKWIIPSELFYDKIHDEEKKSVTLKFKKPLIG